ncbi:MAG: GGDEF domain-containing protein [Gammaproteobacteria bacterium]|nr:GGDEF domain-containing protein [Gammaproteobacteria bacterium]
MKAGEQAWPEEFGEYYRRETRWSSVLLFVYVAANFLLSPTYRHWLLGLPDSPVPAIWVIEYGLIVPAALAGAFARWRWSGHGLAEHATLTCVTLIALCLVATRYVWITQGGQFFAVLNAYFLTGAMAMTGIGFRRLSAVAAAVLELEAAVSYAVYGWSPQANFEVLSFVTAAFVVLIVGWHVERSMRATWQYAKDYERLAKLDPLTGLPNCRTFEDSVNPKLAQAAAAGCAVGVAMLDLDFFKPYNDRYGHPAGDRALKRVAAVLGAQLHSPDDIAARMGGEEFALFWYGVSPDEAARRCRLALEAVRELRIAHHASTAGARLTVSVGAVQGVPRAEFTLAALLRRADINLYRAKMRGRDQAVATPLEAAVEDAVSAAV